MDTSTTPRTSASVGLAAASEPVPDRFHRMERVARSARPQWIEKLNAQSIIDQAHHGVGAGFFGSGQLPASSWTSQPLAELTHKRRLSA